MPRCPHCGGAIKPELGQVLNLDDLANKEVAPMQETSRSMKLDTTKKYTFAGDVYQHSQGFWLSVLVDNKWSWSTGSFQHFADNGLVIEVKEPRRFKVRLTFTTDGQLRSLVLADNIREAIGRGPLDYNAVKGSIWEIEGTEIL